MPAQVDHRKIHYPMGSEFAKSRRRGSIHAFAGGIGKGLEVGGVAVEEVVGGGDDITGVVEGGLEAFVDELAGAGGGAVFQAGVLVEAADEKEFGANAAGSFLEVAVAAHGGRGHGFQAIGAVLGDQIEHLHQAAAEVVDDFDAGFVQGFMLLEVVGKAEFLEHGGGDDGIGARTAAGFDHVGGGAFPHGCDAQGALQDAV